MAAAPSKALADPRVKASTSGFGVTGDATVEPKPAVLIFRNNMLPCSETFVLAQAKALTKFRPVFAAVHRSEQTLVGRDDAVLLNAGLGKSSEVARRWYWATAYAPGFHRRLQTFAPQLIHAHFAPDGAAALPIQKALDIPLVVTLHGYDVTRRREFFRSKPENRLYVRKQNDLWAQASLFLCVSEFIREQALARGFPEHKLQVLPIGIDHSTFSPMKQTSDETREAHTVVFVGRLVEKKGCTDLLAAAEQLTRSGVAIKVVFVGDGPLRTQLEHAARSKDLPCEFVGMQTVAQVRRYLSQARVFCGPSKQASDGDGEGLGMVFAEAQAQGVPVVSYRHGGVPEIVEHGVTGTLVPEGDVLLLGEALASYLQDDALAKRHGEAGARAMRKRFCLARQTEALEACYASVIEAHAQSSR